MGARIFFSRTAAVEGIGQQTNFWRIVPPAGKFFFTGEVMFFTLLLATDSEFRIGFSPGRLHPICSVLVSHFTATSSFSSYFLRPGLGLRSLETGRLPFQTRRGSLRF
ncbi:hypothetical protein HC766_07320 [Candidatus Gracilibacteria bacterium]|nr:hypothetical protein [Candidatus Gracilibacteria bacterium]